MFHQNNTQSICTVLYYVLGVYLPLLWEPSFCWKSPIALGYTRGHFSALVPVEPDTPENLGAGKAFYVSGNITLGGHTN